MKAQFMKALVYDPCSDHFSVLEQALPSPGPHDVLVRVHACGLNPVDAKIHQWQAMVPGMSADWVPGLDVAGEIAALGSAVDSWKVGDRVLYHGDMFRPHGGFAEFAVQDARTLTRRPDVSPELAAATPCAG
jgi:NADPH:quinone reductase-like Zn-dependent oxidoreductase